MTDNWLIAILMLGFFAPLAILSIGAAIATVRRAAHRKPPASPPASKLE